MIGNFRDSLRALRGTAGLSLGALAAQMNYSRAAVGRVEDGTRSPTVEFAVAADKVLGSTPLLVTLLGLEGEDDTVRRRALMTAVTSAAAVSAVAGHLALAEIVRRVLHEAVEAPESWDTIIAELERRLVSDLSADFGDSLLAQLMVGGQQIAQSGDPEVMRAHAIISLTYGLWLANVGNLSAAHSWYRTATTVADRSGDRLARAYVRARVASRGPFDGLSVASTRAQIDAAVDVGGSAASLPTLEAHGAGVHLAALTGDLTEGRREVTAMRRIADQLGDAQVARAAMFNAYLECRLGSLPEAETAMGEAQRLLRHEPLLLNETHTYFGRALVRAGDVAGGVSHALTRAQRMPPTRWVKVAVSDLIAVVPSGYRSEDLDELAQYAAPAGPWEHLA